MQINDVSVTIFRANRA